MLKILLLILSLYISVVDIQTHRISNLSNLALGSLLIFDIHNIEIWMTLIFICLALIATLIIRLGMGDFKLIVVLLITQSAIVVSLQYLSLFLMTATATICISILTRKGLTGSVAFGPTILLPFTAIYLAI